jgi:hypothetical protein
MSSARCVVTSKISLSMASSEPVRPKLVCSKLRVTRVASTFVGRTLTCVIQPEIHRGADKSLVKIKISLLHRPWRPLGLREVEAPTLLRQTANRWRECYQPHAPAALYPPGSFFKIPGTHF